MTKNKIRSATINKNAGQAVVYGLILITSAVELCLTAADLEWIGSPYWRGTAYSYGAFYAQLLSSWTGNFSAQPITMFVTYAFLHGGLLHLVVNMMALASFGPIIANQVGSLRFIFAYFFCSIGGVALYGILSTSDAPVVGASGALFGLLGVWICWGYLDRRHYGEGLREIYRAVFFLILYNVAFFVLLSGRLAWETHLGGFVVGWLIALFWGRQTYQRRQKGGLG